MHCKCMGTYIGSLDKNFISSFRKLVLGTLFYPNRTRTGLMGNLDLVIYYSDVNPST